jgi:hypothetical protein
MIGIHRIDMHAAELLLPDPSPSQTEITIEKLKKYKSPGNDQILAEQIQVGGETLVRSKHYWVSGLCPSSRILITEKKVSATGSVSILR